MKRYSRRLKNFLYLGKKSGDVFDRKIYQITYLIIGHDYPKCLVHCVVDIVDGVCNGKGYPIILYYEFNQEKEDGTMIEFTSFDKKENDYVDRIVNKMFDKGKIKFD